MNPWVLSYEGFDPASEGLREALCTLGNGRFATRGATPDGELRTPGTYVAGCYDRLDSTVAGRTVTNEDLVNLPDWLPVTFATPGSAWFRPERAELLDYRQELDMRQGILHRALRWRDESGRVTAIRQRRLVSMADPRLAALETTFTAENWSGPLRIRATLDGRVTNSGVARYRELRGDHLTGHDTGDRNGLIWLTATTRASRITVALACRTDTVSPAREVIREGDRIATHHVLDLARGESATLTKTVALVTSRDSAVHDARSAAIRAVRRAPRFDWRRLPEARAAARDAGYDGAMFPWQSGSDGREETQTLHLNPASGRWLPDGSHLQRHIGPAIAYNVWQYYLATGLMPPWCAELLIEIARFFASLTVLDPASGRYEIRGVMGPDEYHERYPGASSPGLANNAYTNIMTVWLLSRARDTLELQPEPTASEQERARWDDITRRMRVDFHDGVISQFTGYPDLLELDWARYRGVRRLDRTSHGSTLSAVVHAWVLSRSDRARSWQFFAEALFGDINDIQGGTTAEGIHLGAMAGTLDLLQRCYLGLEPRPDGLHLNPLLPDRLGVLSLSIRFRGHQLLIDADHRQAHINGVESLTFSSEPFARRQGETIMTSTGDLGRRITYHRVRLGLTVDQVAERAEMSPGYLQYLEERPGTPTAETMYRLAGALETTVDDLLGSGVDRPPGRGRAAGAPTLESLDPEECLKLIEPGGIGRVAFSGSHGPTVLPVNYRLHHGFIVFRTAPGGPMDQDLRTGVEGVEIKVGFEVDRIDDAQREGWSVLIQGPAHHISPDELSEVTDSDVTPWAGGERPLYIRIVPHQITGRRIHHL
ncbi:pyridoxamine 5'-phosphate oxidase family protein [Nonomuraea sp. NPDC049028]|uniref:pyridoxamine 5'-phosphate oxidase family protein n=1 Tax=Nonomuraea sp. NPDC049028 TaxID=3364348 RepID=UPI0037141185